uniref:Protein phosphatase 1, regulatory subunit 35 n=1 Tax=Rattus norvegicus TaxID=10116 RepID=A0A8I5ZNP1_RAT
MMNFGTSPLESIESEGALETLGPPPEPRAPEPWVLETEPGLDLSLSPSPLPESPKQRKNSPGQRKGRRGGSRRGRQVRFQLAPPSPVRSEPRVAAGALGDGHELEAPALQSSLALSLELQNARAAVASGQFNASKAVEEQLRKSFQTRCVLEETVAEGLNVPRSKRLYRDLVSLQVPEEQVLNAALREKLAMLPPQPRAPPPKVLRSSKGSLFTTSNSESHSVAGRSGLVEQVHRTLEACREEHRGRNPTHCERLSPAVGRPRLGLQDQNAPRSQMPVDPAEHSLQPLITPVQVHPLGEAEAEHHIILRSLGIHQLISVQDIVTLWARRGEDVKKRDEKHCWPHNHLRTENLTSALWLPEALPNSTLF